MLDDAYLRWYFVFMNNKQKVKKNSALKREHFEILLEDIQYNIKAISEGYTLLNDKVDNLGNVFRTEIRETRQELIFLIKATVERSEERLTKKIEDGDNAVIAQLTKKIEDGDNAVIAQLTKKIEDGDNAVIAQLTKKIEDGDNAVIAQLTKKIEDGDNTVKESVISHIDLKIDEIKDILKIHADKLDDHETRLSKIEHRE